MLTFSAADFEDFGWSRSYLPAYMKQNPEPAAHHLSAVGL